MWKSGHQLEHVALCDPMKQQFTATVLLPRFSCLKTHVHVHTHTHVNTHIQVRIHLHTRARTHVYTHTRTHTHLHTRARTHTHVHTHTHTHARTHVHTYTHGQPSKYWTEEQKSQENISSPCKFSYNRKCAPSPYIYHFTPHKNLSSKRVNYLNLPINTT
jgi:hypothetical protein